jgi:hypothetical protein
LGCWLALDLLLLGLHLRWVWTLLLVGLRVPFS